MQFRSNYTCRVATEGFKWFHALIFVRCLPSLTSLNLREARGFPLAGVHTLPSTLQELRLPKYIRLGIQELPYIMDLEVLEANMSYEALQVFSAHKANLKRLGTKVNALQLVRGYRSGNYRINTETEEIVPPWLY